MTGLDTELREKKKGKKMHPGKEAHLMKEKIRLTQRQTLPTTQGFALPLREFLLPGRYSGRCYNMD